MQHEMRDLYDYGIHTDLTMSREDDPPYNMKLKQQKCGGGEGMDVRAYTGWRDIVLLLDGREGACMHYH
ncbi:hypothetical protein F5146DRAFT_1129262 [Armillaria mellea]|nr:hypothetical protein F5146DRAFT_1129262 [Armillaria mellea]